MAPAVSSPWLKKHGTARAKLFTFNAGRVALRRVPVTGQYQNRGLWQAVVFRTYPCATRATRADDGELHVLHVLHTGIPAN